MSASPRESVPPTAPVPHARDQGHEERTTRKAWSMVAAVAIHAAALASWPELPNRLSLLALDPTAIEEPDPDQPQWIFMDEAGGTRAAGAGEGQTQARPGSGPVPVEARGITTADADPEGLSQDLRDRLVRSTSFAPSLAEPADPLGILPSSSNESTAAAAGAGLGGLAASDLEAMEELSALDLERLTAIRPEVALEASSNWVLVRNPVQVRDFILRHPSNVPAPTGGRGAVSVAIWVSAAGSVEWAEIITSSGKEEWDDLALELFNDVVMFRPARLEGVPMPMSAIFTVDFPW